MIQTIRRNARYMFSVMLALQLLAAASVSADAVRLQEKDTLVIHTQLVTATLSHEGQIIGLTVGPNRLPRQVTALTRLPGCSQEPNVQRELLPGGGVKFVKTLTRPHQSKTFTLNEYFIPDDNSIRWEIEIIDHNSPWSVPIETTLRYGRSGDLLFWTAWGDPRRDHIEKMMTLARQLTTGRIGYGPLVDAAAQIPWADPLEPQKPQDALFYYGAPPITELWVPYAPFIPNTICMPVATFIEPGNDIGLTLVLSPEDNLLDLALSTAADETVTFKRLCHRIGNGKKLRFTAHIVPHQADWRPAVGWMTRRYPRFFEPPNPKAHQLAGTCAYSNHDADVDPAKLSAMAFAVNWRASFDFPYMGMFLPPVSDDDQWQGFGGRKTSFAEMDDYARRMNAMGFHVLEYFNVTEFGTNIKYPPPPDVAAGSPDVWKDPSAFLYTKLKGAVVTIPEWHLPQAAQWGQAEPGHPYYTWEGAIVTDCGSPDYRKFLLEQAARHIDKLPHSAGLAIDRLDWLRLYNTTRDDGVSWFHDRPAASLLLSWRNLMEELGPLVHRSDKVIFVNEHLKRIELLEHVDGIFDEHAYCPGSLNTAALLGLFKPVLGWTKDANEVLIDPDAFFQEYLYMGAFPTAPFPGNDHCIGPDPEVEGHYVRYGAMMKALRGKRWVFLPHVVEVVSGNARANLFEIPGGFVAPVVFAHSGESVRLALQGSPFIKPLRYHADALHPGKTDPIQVKYEYDQDRLVLNVPTERGCAMVRLMEKQDDPTE